jgi:hypothetical protein
MTDLSQYTDAELEDAQKHIARLEVFVNQEMKKNPGPGWTPVINLLNRDATEIATELALR